MSNETQLINEGRSDLVFLPEGTKLMCWKVQNGSPVRVGETIAVAVPKDYEVQTTTTATNNESGKSTNSVQKQHKRPTRRRRPVPAVTTDDTKVNEQPTGTTKSDKLSATATATSSTTSDADKDSATTTSKPATNNALVANNDKQQVLIVAKADGILNYIENNKDDTVREIGQIKPCQHPTMIDGMCAVCGVQTRSTASAAINDDDNGNIDNSNDGTNNKKMSQMTVSGLTVVVSEEEGQRLAQQDAIRLQKLNKLSLVLDLDHTLVHATADPRAQEYKNIRNDVRSLILPVPIQQQNNQQQQQRFVMQQHFVKLRPYVKEFLQYAIEKYEIGVYTAGTREYAEQIAILLARHIVGTDLDQVDLDMLRHKLANIEYQLQKQQQQEENSKEQKEQKESIETSKVQSKIGEVEEDGVDEKKDCGEIKKEEEKEEKESTKQDTENGNQSTSGKKRKRVTFGETPPSYKADKISKENVEKLRKELEDAEQLEKQALELRQKLFGSRVVSRTEVGDLGRDVKSLKRIFPCGGSMAVVVDDREDVWANAQDIKSTRPGEPPDNMLLVRPYHFASFVGFADVNNASGVDLSGVTEENQDHETDQQLLWTSDVLKRLHERYYSIDDDSKRPNVPDLLRDIRLEVLRDCQIILSGLVPLHKQVLDSNKARHPFIRYVQNLGATLLFSVNKSVTHVVAAKDGTDKIIAARKIPGCQIVKASWLMECVWSLQKVNESAHQLGPPPSTLPRQSTVASRKIETREDTKRIIVQPLTDSKKDNSSNSSSSDDDDDDDFAADLENEMMAEEE